MRKILYIIPGFGDTPEDQAYKLVAKIAESKNYEVRTITLLWERSTIEDWIKTASKIIDTNTAKNFSILGFSFGAMVAVAIAKKYHFTKLHLCSLSPFYMEDIDHLPGAAKKFLGKRRLADFATLIFPDDIGTPAYFYFGTADWDYALKQIKRRAKTWKGAHKLILIDGVGHDLENSAYLDVLEKNL